MTPALTLLAAAFAAGWFAPALLRRIDLRRRDPVLTIVAWLLSMAGVLLTAATGVVVLLLPDHGATVLAALHHCWAVIQHGSPPRVEALTGLAGVAILVTLAARLVVVFVRGERWRANKHQESLAVLRVGRRRTDGPTDVLWLAHERPLAFSMAGRPNVVVVTDGLTAHLTPDAVAAVLAHERAHLTGRHHLLVALAEAARATLPFLRLFRQAPQAIRQLVELAADSTAARACGAPAVRAAILTVARHGMPSTALPMGSTDTAVRLVRLDQGVHLPGKLRRTVSCGLTALASGTLPLLTGFGLLAGLAYLVCPTG